MNVKNIFLCSFILATQSAIGMQDLEKVKKENPILYCRYRTRCCDPVVACNIAIEASQKPCYCWCQEPCPEIIACCPILWCLSMCHASPVLSHEKIVERIVKHQTLCQILSCKKAPEPQAMP